MAGTYEHFGLNEVDDTEEEYTRWDPFTGEANHFKIVRCQAQEETKRKSFNKMKQRGSDLKDWAESSWGNDGTLHFSKMYAFVSNEYIYM